MEMTNSSLHARIDPVPSSPSFNNHGKKLAFEDMAVFVKH